MQQPNKKKKKERKEGTKDSLKCLENSTVEEDFLGAVLYLSDRSINPLTL